MTIAGPDRASEPAAAPAAATAVVDVTPGAPPRGRRRFVPNTFDALSSRNFQLLLSGNTLQFASNQMQTLVRGVLVFQITGSFAALGFVHLAHSVPGFLATPYGGVLADRLPKKTIIQAVQVFNVLNAFALAALAAVGLLGYEALVISSALQGGVNSLMTAARHTVIQDMVGRDKLMNAFALNQSMQNFMQLIGPGLGGLLIAVVSPEAAFVVMGALNLGAVLFTVRLPSRPVDEPTEVAPAHGRRGGGFRDLKDGLRYVASDPTIRTLILVNFGIVLLATPYSMLLPGYVQEVLGKGPAEQGVLMGFSGAGALMGTLVIASLPPRQRGRILLVIATIIAVSLFAFSLSTNYFLTLPIMVFLGGGLALRMTMGQILLQTYSAEAYRGRTVAVWMTQYSIVAFGTFGVGIVAEWIGPQLAIGASAVMLLVLVACVILFVPRLRNLE